MLTLSGAPSSTSQCDDNILFLYHCIIKFIHLKKLLIYMWIFVIRKPTIILIIYDKDQTLIPECDTRCRYGRVFVAERLPMGA